MDPLVILLTTAAGAVAGNSVGILMMRSKLRPPVTDTEFAELKGKLETGERSLAGATENIEGLRKQVARQEESLQQKAGDLKKKQELLDFASAERQNEAARRSTAEQKVQELTARLSSLNEACTKLEGRVREALDIAARKATVEADLESAKRTIQQLTEQGMRLTAEAVELKRFGEQESRFRSALELQLNAEKERIQQMDVRIAELQRERLQIETKLEEEGRSAAKGMEFLLMAQQKLSAAFKVREPESQAPQVTQVTQVTKVAVDGAPEAAHAVSTAG